MTTGEGGDEAQRILRLSDIAKEPLELLMPICGYEEMPIVSLERAVEPLVAFLPAVQSHAYVAKGRCKNPPSDGLTIDESASIMLYSMGWKPLDKCLYVALNAVLRSANRDELEPWFLYLKLFLTALSRLPSTHRHVYRGVKLDLHLDYPKDKTIIWWGFSSCTVSIDVLQSESFLGTTGTRTMFCVDCDSGKDIRKHSYYPKEDEILLLAATQFKVMGCLQLANGLYIIQLQETKSPFPLLHPIAFSSNANEPSSESPSFIKDNSPWKQYGIVIAGGNDDGKKLNQLSFPYGIYVDDDSQSIYIADSGNDRIVKWKYDAKNGDIVAGGNGKGDRMDQLHEPTDMIVDKKNDSLIICDYLNKRVIRSSCQKDKNQQIIISDIHCYGLTMDNNGNLYVSDWEKNEVILWKIGDTNGTIIAGGNGKGNNLNQFNYPTYIFVDKDYSVYVSDTNNHRVMKWMKGAKEGIIVAGGQGEGNSLIQLSSPYGFVVDDLGNVYVADHGNNRIVRWLKGSKEGNIMVGGNGKGKQSNQFDRPIGLSFDREGNLYVVDYGNDRVEKFILN